MKSSEFFLRVNDTPGAVSRGENRGEGCRVSWKARRWPRGRLALDSVNLLFGEVPRAPWASLQRPSPEL